MWRFYVYLNPRIGGIFIENTHPAQFKVLTQPNVQMWYPINRQGCKIIPFTNRVIRVDGVGMQGAVAAQLSFHVRTPQDQSFYILLQKNV